MGKEWNKLVGKTRYNEKGFPVITLGKNYYKGCSGLRMAWSSYEIYKIPFSEAHGFSSSYSGRGGYYAMIKSGLSYDERLGIIQRAMQCI